MPKLTAKDTLDLSIPERIQLVEDIWDTIQVNQQTVELTKNEKKIIDNRLSEYHLNPEIGVPWEEVKKKILKNNI